ncbi:MAG: hypothetical protein K2N51_16460 [Lachnospiraceae bacterium]|nr:hypothetical protein [Lachnospiraceae bacterium]
MGKLCLYEWKKLFRQHTFLFFTLILLFGNLFTLFQYEKHTDYYTYFYRFKQDWQKYKNGDTAVSNAEYYQYFEEEAENYVSSYDGFLKQIPEQAENLKKTKDYQNHNTYLYRNLTKTVFDYKNLSTDGIKEDPSIGIKELASYNYGIYFQLIFLFVLSYFVISAERKKGLFLLTKGTKKGHIPLAAAKLLTMISASVLYGFLQECGVFMLLGYYYGYGDFTRKIQSVSIFRDCSVSFTVAQTMMILFVVRILIGILVALLIFGLTISFRREGTALLIYVGVLVVEMLLNYGIQISSSLNIAKCVNVFFAWNMKNLFGTYVNLNLFGYPIGKSLVTLVVGGILACIFIFAGLYRFSASCQISAGNLLEEIREKITKRISFGWHHTSVYLFEFQKVFFQQKRGYLFLFLLIWCVLCTREIMEPSFYNDPEEAEYHRILSEISGPVTEESLNYIASQREELDALYEQVGALEEQSGAQAEFQMMLLTHEIKNRDGGVRLIEEQRDRLLEKTGDIFSKFWVDEKDYINTFYAYKYDLKVFFVGMIALVLWMSEIEAEDNRNKLYPLLYATVAGKRHIQKKKKQVCITGMFWCVLCTLIPQFLRYHKIDHFESARQKLQDFTMLELNTSLSIGTFVLLLLLVKILLFILACRLLLMLVRRVCNMELVIGAGAGCIGLVILLLWYFRIDLTIVSLRAFSLW